MTRGPVSVLVSEFVTNVIVQLETNSGDLLTYSECEPGYNDSPILQLSTGNSSPKEPTRSRNKINKQSPTTK